MILLIDFTGILVIVALIWQGYIEGLQFRPSLMLASLCSVIIFVCFFSGVYTLAMSLIPYSIISGLLTVILLNSICIFFFHKLFSGVIALIQTRFFIPQISDRNKKIGGMIIGACVGYIFVAGMITSFEDAMVYRKHRHTNLVDSLFYKQNDELKQTKVSRKIDNIPALHELYSQINVEKFNFTEQELLAIMKIIREISNEDAKEILRQLKNKEKIGLIYLHLIEIYSRKTEISKKYFVSKDEILTLKTKIEEINKIQGTIKTNKTIESVIENTIKS